MKKHLSFTLLLTMFVSGCVKNDLEEKPLQPISGRVFTASFESEDARTYVEEGNLLRWNAGDQITLFDSNTLNRQYQFDGETGDNAGTFSIVNAPFGTGNDLNCHYALYPYASNVKITENGVITATLPAVQSYAENSFGLGANTMVAVTKDTKDTFLKFRNVGGYLKLQLYGENVTVKSITLTGNNNEKLAGKATITPAYGQSPILAMSDDATTSITLDCGEGVKIGTTAETATAFWIVVPPTSFEEGLTITVTEIDGESFNKSTSNAVVVERNTIKPMATFEVEIEKIPNNQIWYTSTYGKISPDSDAFGVAITSNVYQDGEGIITFDGDVRKIGDDAFIAQDRLASITLPNSVKSIGREAFASCTSLTSIIMSKNITTIEREAFEECSSLTSISIPNGVTHIEFETFRDCSSLTSVTIPNSVISVGGSSFYNCTSLTSVNIPNSVTSIHGTTFHGCASLKSIVVEQGNPIYDSRENCNAIIETETNKLISGCNNTSIPSSVTSISQQAFSGRTSLTSILVPNSVTSIEFLAFADCTSLASITIGSGVTDIATKAFLGCTSLSTVDITATIPPQIYNETFTNCSSNLKIYVPAGSLEAYKAAEYWKDLNIMTDTIPNNQIWYTSSDGNVVTPGKNTFSAITGSANVFATITSNVYSNGRGVITFDSDIDEICAKAFYSFTTLTSVTIPNSVTYIGNNAFGKCTSLISVELPNNITSMADAFNSCSSLTRVSLPNKLTEIPSQLFYGCTSLSEVTIPESVTSIGQSAFYGCTSLSEITIPDSVTSIGKYAFHTTGLISFTFPSKIKTINAYSVYNCKSLENITIPSTVTSIEYSAFFANPALKTVRIYATQPPTITNGNAIFNGSTHTTCVLEVPKGRGSVYYNSTGWAFSTIREIQ